MVTKNVRAQLKQTYYLLFDYFIVFKYSLPARSKEWIQTRTNLFNQNVNQKLVPRRLEHFLRFYLEPDGKN